MNVMIVGVAGRGYLIEQNRKGTNWIEMSRFQLKYVRSYD